MYLLNTYFNTTVQIDIFNATHDVKRALRESKVENGLLTVFIPGATAGLAILENDPSIHLELKKLLESIIPSSKTPRPSRKSGTGSNETHLRASFLSKSIVIPIKDGKLFLGPWQEVIAYDFDDKVARREIMISIMEEAKTEEKKA